MGGILLLFSFLLCGVAAADAIFARRCGLVRLWLGLVGGLMLMMWTPIPFAFIFDFTVTAQLLGLAAAVALSAACVISMRRVPRANVPFCGGMPVWLPIVLVIPLTILSGYLQYTHTLRDVNGALHVGQSTYGDLCLHTAIATTIMNSSFPPDYPILKGTLLGYPFLVNSMVSSMLLFGSDIALSFQLAGTLMMALVYVGFVILAWELTKRPAAVVLAFILLFFNGGLGFLYTLDGVMKDPSALRAVFTGFYKTPTNQPDLNLRWVNIVCDMLVPQRTFLAGWTVLLPAIYQLVIAMRENKRQSFIVLGIWAGMMPMIHTHSFLALGMLSACAMLCKAIRPGKHARGTMMLNFLIYGVIAVVMAVPQLMIWTFPQTSGGNYVRLLFNWVNNQGNGKLIDGYFWFWIKNVGLVYLLVLPAVLSCKKGSANRVLALGALLIYTIAELFQFQPNIYDNNKLFYVSFMVVLPAVGLYLCRLWEALQSVRGRALLAALFIFASTCSSVLTYGREIVSDYQLLSADEVEAAEFVKENTARDAFFLTGQQHNNAVNMLAGRYILCGTGSFLYYHGLNYSTQQTAARLMYEQPAANESLFDEYGIDYAYFSSTERSDYVIDQAYFDENALLVFANNSVAIYAVSDEAIKRHS